MSINTYKHIWTRQPNIAVSVDWANPLTQNVLGAVIPINARSHIDVVSKTLMTQSYWSAVVDHEGRGLIYSGSGAQSSASTLKSSASTTPTACLVVVRRFDASTNTAIAASTKTASVYGVTLELNATGWYTTAAPSSGGRTVQTTDTSTRGVFYVVYDPITGEHSIYLSGNQIGTANLGASNLQASSNGIYISGSYNRAVMLCVALGGSQLLTDPAFIREISANPWQIFQPLERRIWVPSAAGGTTITGNPVTWQWETNNVVAKEKVSTTPTDWQWLVTTGAITEEIATTPIDWQWFVTTGSIQEGATTTITGNPIAWEWQSGTASFVQKIDGTPVNWEWQVTTGEVTENLNTTPVNWEWQTTTGQILGTDAIDTTPVVWQWEVTQGNVVYLQPQQTSGTIGGKKDKRVNLPYYEGKDYESRIDLEETVRNDSHTVADFLDARGDVVRDDSRGDSKPVELDNRTSLQTGIAIGDLLAEFKEEAKSVSVIELPQVEESEGFDEEAAVIMLLLAA